MPQLRLLTSACLLVWDVLVETAGATDHRALGEKVSTSMPLLFLGDGNDTTQLMNHDPQRINQWARADSLTKGWHHEGYVHLFIQILCASVCIPLSVKLERMQDGRPPLAQIPQVQRVVCTGWDQRPLEDRKDTSACNPSVQQELFIHRLCRAVIFHCMNMTPSPNICLLSSHLHIWALHEPNQIFVCPTPSQHHRQNQAVVTMTWSLHSSHDLIFSIFQKWLINVIFSTNYSETMKGLRKLWKRICGIKDLDFYMLLQIWQLLLSMYMEGNNENNLLCYFTSPLPYGETV